MSENSPPPDENPFASPQEASPPMMRPDVRPLSVAAMVGVTLLSLFAGLIAFCCSCFPVGVMLFSYPDQPAFASAVPWIVGAIVGGGATYLVWRLMTRAMRRPR